MRRRSCRIAPIATQLLGAFSRPKSPERVAFEFPPYTPESVMHALRQLRRLRFLVPASERLPAAADQWAGFLAAAHYDFAVRDLSFHAAPRERLKYLKERLRKRSQPQLYKRYPKSRRIPLPTATPTPANICDALRERRTMRQFSRRHVSFGDFAAVIRGTFGQTGWIDAGILGQLVAKTSPSAGARHPIECYVVAWNVFGLPRGLYHYNVQSDCLERLRLGNFRSAAVRVGSGFGWIGRAAFLCVMTAVKDRLLWKYPTPKAYSLFCLDAGHLGQTFALLATARGMAPFTTAALQHSEVEDLFRVDGTQELPVYLCGAGMPQATSKLRRGSSRDRRLASSGSL